MERVGLLAQQTNHSYSNHHHDHNHHHEGQSGDLIHSERFELSPLADNRRDYQQEAEEAMLLDSSEVNTSEANSCNSSHGTEDSSTIDEEQSDCKSTNKYQTGQEQQEQSINHDFHNEPENDDDAFIAYCADTSSVLNNDPTRRCYINKLYQPMNAQQDPTDSSLVEHNDEYLLYQELKYIQSSAQLIDEREQRQLSKILEDDDDDGEDGPLDENNHHHHQDLDDPLDRLQLTNIIESFDDLASPPPSLIENCHDSDLLMTGSSPTVDKPDSTGYSDDSPTSTYTNCTSENNYNNSVDHHQHHHHHQFDESGHDGQQFNLGLKSTNNQFMSPSMFDVHRSPEQEDHYNDLRDNNTSQISQQHHQEKHILSHQYNQTNQDNLSEINCFQVSSTYTPAPQWSSHLQPMTMCNNNESSQNQDTTISSDDVCKKRPLDEEEALSQPVTSNKKMIKKTKRTNNETQIEKNKPASMKQQQQQQQQDTKTEKTHEEYQREHIKKSLAKLSDQLQDSVDEDEEDSMTDDTSIKSGGGKRNPTVSKYRRRTANARERIRMREINQAFEKLKKVVPVELMQQSASGDDESDQRPNSQQIRPTTGHKSSSGSQQQQQQQQQQQPSEPVKLTKITTLRLAVAYIAKLTEVLNQHPEHDGGNVRLIERSGPTESQPDERSSSVNNQQAARSSESKATKRTKRSKAMAKRAVNDAKQEAKEKPKQIVVIKQQPPNLSDSPQAKVSASVMQVEPTTIVRLAQTNTNDQQRQQPILITNSMLNQRGLNQQATFVTLAQQQHPMTSNKFNGFSNHQPIMISQPTGNGSERTFVTPVALAILGIPSANSQGGPNESQQFQIIGVQNGQRGQPAGKFQAIQSQPQYNLQIAQPQQQQQPQQVTFTLDRDINGMSVLRLANPIASQPAQFQSNQQQQQQPQIVNQQPHLITATSSTGYNYTYQPIQLQQQQHQNDASNNKIATSAQGTVQFSAENNNLIINGSSSFVNNNSTATTMTTNTTANINHQVGNSIGTTTPITTTITGINSDCRNFSISPANQAIPVAQSNCGNNLAQVAALNQAQQQIRIQPPTPTTTTTTSSSSIQTILHPSTNFITIAPASGHLFQSNQNGADRASIGLANQAHPETTTNLVYVNQTNASQLNQKLQNSLVEQQQQQHQHPQRDNTNSRNDSMPRNEMKTLDSMGGKTNGNSQESCENQPPFGQQTKLIMTQFGGPNQQQQQEAAARTKGLSSNEASISQLVASLATSIHPSGDKQSKTNAGNQSGGKSDVQRAPQRTYRFHNYDGNMITNHMYNNNNNNNNNNHNHSNASSQDRYQQHRQPPQQHQQQQQQLQTNTKKNVTNNHQTGESVVGGGQRSRQNSLSSICSSTSSTSSSSSSLVSSCSASPANLPVVSIMVKSPVLDSGSGGDAGNANHSPPMIMLDDSSTGPAVEPARQVVAAAVGGN